MADRRMFNKVITEADPFTEMPPTTQCLYFHLCMTADDDGFSNKIRQALFNAHATTDDFNMLVNKKFIIPFESGVIVIKHWRIHNYIRNDRYHETAYLEEKAQLLLKDNDAYTLSTVGIPLVDQMETEDRLGKDRLGKVSLGKVRLIEVDASDDAPAPPKKQVKHKYGQYNNVLLTDDEYSRLEAEYGLEKLSRAIDWFSAYIAEKGYKSKSHNLAMRRWVFNAVDEASAKRATSARGAINYDEMKDW